MCCKRPDLQIQIQHFFPQPSDQLRREIVRDVLTRSTGAPPDDRLVARRLRDIEEHKLRGGQPSDAQVPVLRAAYDEGLHTVGRVDLSAQPDPTS